MRSLRPAVIVALSAASLSLTIAAAPAVAAPKTALVGHGSIGQAYVVGAPKRAPIRLTNAKGKTVASGRTDKLGSKVFRTLKPGPGYRFVVRSGRRAQSTKAFTVLRPGQNPPQSFYKHQTLHKGLNYVKMRDGVELAMTVRLPTGAKSLKDGPFPTFIEYSGYQVAAPHDLLKSVIAQLSDPSAPSDPLAPASSTAVGSLLGPLLGFAVVSVQMRGSGCSGGAFDLFDLPTTYDGYDAVEAVAAQKWVKGGKVGMGGISFSGITQLFTGGTQPPHLAALAPMSVTDDVYSGTGYPGGIFNQGFALSWIQERMSDAQPAPAGGQPYARALAKTDKHCRDNQRLRLQTQNALTEIRQNPYRTPSLFAQRAPGAWLGKTKVPVFLVGSFQDEQTGGHFAESLAELSKNNPRAWITLQNGVHADSLSPSVITRWAEFMDLYVADTVPKVPGTVLSLSGELYKYLADAGANPVEQSRFADTTDVAADKAIFEQDPRVTLLMDNGAGSAGPGSIGATWQLTGPSWPLPAVTPTDYYLGTSGNLADSAPADGSASYTPDPSARPKQTLPGDGDADAWKAQPPYTWAPLADGKGLGWTGPVLAGDLVIAGPSSLDVYLKSTKPDTDLQVTLTEVRPDGNETYVQNGWLRASHRKLDAAKSTADDPVPTHLKADGAPLPAGQFSLVRVPIFPVAHAFRAGSRIRVTITAPGGDRPRWDFATLDDGTGLNTVGLGGATPSKLVLPVLPGATALGTPLPAPTALRGEPNRTYVAASNGG